jgi:hypothetical protein
MKNKLANPLRKYFAEQLKQEWPNFIEVKESNLPSGCRLYEWKLGTNFKFYLLLQISEKAEEFTLELAWTELDGYPYDSHTISPWSEPINGSLRFRIGKLWADRKTDFWWYVVQPLTPEESLRKMKARDFSEPSIEELLPKVNPLVDDAIFHIQKYVIPYMQEISKKYGYELTL